MITNKSLLGDLLLTMVRRALNLHWTNCGNLADEKGNIIEWTDMLSVDINVHFQGKHFVQINFFGDGTLEFQTDEPNAESLNWYHFNEQTIYSIINDLRIKEQVKC